MKNNHEKEIKVNDSIINENEKFFTELATAYVKKDGGEIRARDNLQASKLSTDHLDKKMKWRMKGISEKSKRTRRNRMAVLSALAACFFMFIVYYAVSPVFLRNDFPASPGADMMEEHFFATEAEAEAMEEAMDEATEAEMDIAETPPEEIVGEVVIEVEEGDFDHQYFQEDLALGFGIVVDRRELDPQGVLSFDCILGVRGSREDFEEALPDGYYIAGVVYREGSTEFMLLSPMNQRIRLWEGLEPFPEEMHPVERHIETDSYRMDINGVEVVQFLLIDSDKGDYLLHLQARDRYFTVVGSELEELVAVARALIHLPELDFLGEGYGDGTIVTEGDILEEMMNNMRLPRGLVTLVPIP